MLGAEQFKEEEHRRWNRAHVGWLEELSTWEAENEQAKQTLKRLELRLLEQSELYRHHRETMVGLEQTIHRAEHAPRRDPEEASLLRQRHAAAELEHRRLSYQHLAILGAIAHLDSLLEQGSTVQP